MRPHPFYPTPLAIFTAALLCCIAPAAHSETYEDDTTPYSDQASAGENAGGAFSITDETLRARLTALRRAEMERQPVAEDVSDKLDTEAAPYVAAVRSKLPQAVQDPCLTSSDRYCHQKHSAHYRPYVGYSPNGQGVVETNPAIVPLPRGVTNAIAGTGSVGGGSRAPVARAEQAK